MKNFIVLNILLLLPVTWAVSQQPQIQTGTNTGVDAVRIAVPEFRSTATDPESMRLTELFNRVLWDDLEYTGNLVLVSRSFYPVGTFGNNADIRVEDWTKPGVDSQFITFGNIAARSTQFVVEAHLWDLKVDLNREMLGGGGGIRYTVDSTEEATRLVAHRLADDILERLGFGRGIARTKIAFVSDRSGKKEIYVMDYDGNGAHPVTALGDLALTPSISPDGEKIAFTSYRSGVPNIEVISRLDRSRYPFQAFPGTNTTPAWSPDSSRIAWASSKDNTDGTEIYVADWNGRNATRLTVMNGVDISPTWNPRTGREIAFVSERNGTPQIYIMAADGTNVRRIITEGGSAQNPAWSPDGLTIAFAWQKPRGNYDIYLHDLATGRNTQLTQNQRDNERPTWAPDGKHLAFESNRSGTTQIYSMLADGTKLRQLTRTGNNQGPSWSGYIQ